MNAYEILIDATDTDALDTVNALFTNVVVTDAPESAAHLVVTVTATDDALDAYLTTFDFPLDERDDIFTPVD